MRRLVLDVQEDSASSTTLEGLAHVGVSLASSRRAIVGLGAGCSTSAGIPVRVRSSKLVEFLVLIHARACRISVRLAPRPPPRPPHRPLPPPPRLTMHRACLSKRPSSSSPTRHSCSPTRVPITSASWRNCGAPCAAPALAPSCRARRAKSAPSTHRRNSTPCSPSSTSAASCNASTRRTSTGSNAARASLWSTSRRWRRRRRRRRAAGPITSAPSRRGGCARGRGRPMGARWRRERESSCRCMADSKRSCAAHAGGGRSGGSGTRKRSRRARRLNALAAAHGVRPFCLDSLGIVTAQLLTFGVQPYAVTSRRMRSKRLTTVSPLAFLRPAVLLYDDPHSSSSSAASLIASLAAKDLAHEPDLLLVAGTSLRIPGFAKLVKRFAGRVGRNGGLRVLVNRDGVGKEWEGVFDYHGAHAVPLVSQACQSCWADASHAVVGDTNWFAAHMVDWLDVLSAAEASEHTATTAKTETSPGRTLFAPLPARPAYGLHSPAPSSSSVVTRLSLPTTPPRSSPFPLPASASPPPPALAKRARPAPVESVVEDERSPPPLPTPPSSALLAPVALPLPEPTHGVRRVSSTPRAATPRPPKRRRLSNPPGAAAPLAPLPPRMSAAELLARAAARAAREKLERKRAKRERRAKREERRRRREEVPEAGLGEA